MDGGSPVGELRLFGQGPSVQEVGAVDNSRLVGGGDLERFRSTVMEEPGGVPPARLQIHRPVKGGGLALAAALVAAILLVSPRRGAPAGRVLLVVLPFDNLSGEKEQECFSDGMTEEMISQLGPLKPDRLAVVVRASVMHCRGTSKRADEIGRELGVKYVLSGSARRSTHQVRVTAELARAKDQVQLWSGSRDRELRDVLGLQNDVAPAIGRELPAPSVPSRGVAREGSARQARGLRDLSQRSLLLEWNRFTAEAERKAKLRDRYRGDPSFAPAYAWLGSTYQILANTEAIDPNEIRARARPALIKRSLITLE